MGQFKETVFFVDPRGNGWSYSLYMQPPRSIVDVNTQAMDNFVKKLCPLLGNGVKANYARESLRGSPRVSVLGQYAALAQWAGDPSQEIEQAGSVILCQCYDQNFTHKKNLFIHGVWDTAITAGALANPPGWTAKKNAFLNELKNGLYYFLAKIGEQNDAITAVAQQGNKLVITTSAAFFPGPFDGKKRVEVFLRGITSVPTIPSPVLVTPIDPTHAVTKNNFLGAVNNAGTIRMNTYDLIQIKNAFFERATTHRIGRPFKPSAAGRYRRLH